MNKLKNLLQELCPNGVEYKKLADCCVLEKGCTPIQKAIPGEYPLVATTEERKSCSTYQFDKPTVCIPLVSSRGHGVASLNRLYYQEGKFALGNILCGVTPVNSDELSAKFLFYYLNHQKDTLIVPLMRGGANVSLTVDSLKRVKVPVPPMPVQNEIVRIFDSFESLGVELAAELTARKQQYEFYRNKLLDSHTWGKGEPINTTTIGQCCDVLTGFPFDSNQFSSTGIRLMRGMNVKRGYLDFSEENNRYWDSAKGIEKYLLKSDDIIIAMDGSLVGKSFGVVQETDLPLLLVQRVARVRSKKVNVRYLYHCIACGLPDYTDKKKTTGAVPHISLRDIQSFPVTLPSPETQKRIADALDNFDAICSDTNTGLPAEIEAREKQYEHYRDKLLTFKQLP